MVIVPCKDCICIPICRNKAYLDLFVHCSYVNDYLPYSHSYLVRDENKLIEVYSVIQPTNWRLVYTLGHRHSPFPPKVFVEAAGEYAYSRYEHIRVKRNMTISQLKKDWKNGNYTL